MKDMLLCQDMVEKGLLLGADEIEVFYLQEKNIEVMIEKNDLQIPKGDNYAGVGIRVIKNGRIGFSSTNQLDASSLTQTLQAALDIAEMSTASEYNQLPSPKPVQTIAGVLDPKGFTFDMEKAVLQAQVIMEVFSSDPRLILDSANVKGSLVTEAIANSKGVAAREERTLYETMLFGFARDGEDVSSFDLEFGATTACDSLDIRKHASNLAKKMLGSLGAETIPGFKGTVILAPLAAAEIVVHPLAEVLSGQAVLLGQSPFNRSRLGEVIANSLFTLFDDPTMPLGYNSRSFDREGMPSVKLPLISAGKLNSFYYDHRTALKAGTTSTGHAAGDDQGILLEASNLVVQPGKVSLEKMIKGVKQGILVSRFSGNTDAISGDFSGVVKGGYYIEDGQIVKPIREVMIAGNLYQMLRDLAEVSDELVGVEAVYTPYLRFEGVSVTGR